MNFFFGASYKNLISELQIPTFQNRDVIDREINLYEIFIKNNEWKLVKKNKNTDNKSFYYLNENELNNNNIFFLAFSKDIVNFDGNKLCNFNDFTDTSPDFRSNFKLKIKDKGFSSFQSEYPFDLTIKKGTTLSQICSLTNKKADENYLIFKNIFFMPIKEKFMGYFVNYETKKIVKKFELFTNTTNFISIPNSLIEPEIFFITDKYLGIPMYLAIHDGHLSLEHSHPPHEYILGSNRYKKVSELKREMNEIII